MTLENKVPDADRPVDDVGIDQEPGPPQSNVEENMRNLVRDRDDWRRKTEAAHQVLELVGITVDEDGGFDPAQLEAWHESTRAFRERARNDLLADAGYDPKSAEGIVLSQKVDAGELEPDPIALRAYADEHSWKPNSGRHTLVTLTEAEQILGSQRLEALANASTSESSGDPQTEVERAIADARERGDYRTASLLQSNYEKKSTRR